MRRTGRGRSTCTPPLALAGREFSVDTKIVLLFHPACKLLLHRFDVNLICRIVGEVLQFMWIRLQVVKLNGRTFDVPIDQQLSSLAVLRISLP